MNISLFESWKRNRLYTFHGRQLDFITKLFINGFPFHHHKFLLSHCHSLAFHSFKHGLVTLIHIYLQLIQKLTPLYFFSKVLFYIEFSYIISILNIGDYIQLSSLCFKNDNIVFYFLVQSSSTKNWKYTGSLHRIINFVRCCCR